MKNGHYLNKGIINFKLIEFDDHNIISPDIIKDIKLFSNDISYIIKNNYIYNDNDANIAAYINNLNENINDAIITNIFGGEIKVKNIINIIGSGPTWKMLKSSIEK